MISYMEFMHKTYGMLYIVKTVIMGKQTKKRAIKITGSFKEN